MCGIVGLWRAEKNRNYTSELRDMTARLVHRGPDDSGTWVAKHLGLYLGHRRLSVLDLSDSGSQPMRINSGRYVIVFNGEIYNHLSIRKRIETRHNSRSWRGNSDTETLLVSIETFGLESTLAELEGMFAFALWDTKKNILILARDRFGEKPLLYRQDEAGISFASELHALRYAPGFKAEVDVRSVCDFLSFSNIPDPNTIYKDTHKLKPAHYLVFTNPRDRPAQRCYWSIDQIAISGTSNPLSGSIEEKKDEIKIQLENSIENCMISDVPMGAFLSGGIDSSVVAAIAARHSKGPLNTFTIGFDNQDFDEAPYARAVSKFLGADHHEQYIKSEDALDIVPKLCCIYDEPFSDSSQIPTLLLSRFARNDVTVALSGDGGDELFCGYSRYKQAETIWRSLNYLPDNIRMRLSNIFGAVLCKKSGKRKYRHSTNILSSRMDQACRLFNLLGDCSIDGINDYMIRHWKDTSDLVESATGRHRFNPGSLDGNLPDLSVMENAIDRWMLADFKRYLPGSILTKVDRASMYHSLEVRAPFLNSSLAEMMWHIPLGDKFRERENKYLLKSIGYDYIPKALLNRPKKGFGVPICSWLRGRLKGWASQLIYDELDKQGLLNKVTVVNMWEQHLDKTWDWSFYLWDVLMLTDWVRHNSEKTGQ